MRDFFIRISADPDLIHLELARTYFERMFPGSVNLIFQQEGFALVYSSGPDENKMAGPLYSKKENAFLCIAGEFNIPEHLTSGNRYPGIDDAAKIIALYEAHGESVFQEFSGNFNILFFYCREKRFNVINSKLGLYPLYYRQFGSVLLASSRLGIFKFILGKVSIDQSIIMQYCLYNYPVSSKTFIAGVELLPSASILSFNKEALKIKNYWKIGDELNARSGLENFNHSVDLLDQALDKIIKRKCEENNIIGISLTGGLDGRLALAYALKYLSPKQILLYSHGTRDAPDVAIPLEISEKLGYNYLPILLDNPDYARQQLIWANETLKYSDGLRQISRAHYLYNMSVLRDEYGIKSIISGNGGSTLIKSSNYNKPGDVCNHFVMELIKSDDFESTIQKHYNSIIVKYPDLFQGIDTDSFMSSFDLEGLRSLCAIQNKNERFLNFLILEIARKYFGAEIHSYKHLVKNYSPFFDDEFIRAFAQTVFVSSNGSKGLIKGHYISLLYAKLITRHNLKLAKANTNRGFSMYDVANPFCFPKMLFKYFRAKSSRVKDTNYFNNRDILWRFICQYYPEFKLILNSDLSKSAFLSNYISAMVYFKS